MALRLILGNLKLFNPTIFNPLPIASQTIPLINQTRGKSRYTFPVPKREKYLNDPLFESTLTPDLEEFILRQAEENAAQPGYTSPIVTTQDFNPGEWKEGDIRVGTIGRKIGIYPLWDKNGVRVLTTLIQLVDNHVLQYIPPENFQFNIRYRNRWQKMDPDPSRSYARMVVGAGHVNPLNINARYLNLFNQAGVLPKARVMSFIITDNAKLPPGQALGVSHYKVGDYVDVSNNSINHGFQGVMKRFGFKGGPATHGCTKNHRRMGSLSTGKKRGIWKGRKMPGIMGGKWVTSRSQKILRINYEHNVLYVRGASTPGEVNTWVMVKDAYCHPFTKDNRPPAFPCDLEYGLEPPAEEEVYHDSIHKFSDPSLIPQIAYLTRKKKKKL